MPPKRLKLAQRQKLKSKQKNNLGTGVVGDFMSDIEKYSKSDFESAKQHTEDGVEFWSARDLKDILEYEQWRNFLKVVEKAKESCKKRYRGTFC